LTVSQVPAHTHPLLASTSPGTSNNGTGLVPAASPSVEIYEADVVDHGMAPGALSQTGGSQPHDNFQPYLCVDFIISLFGIFPSQT